MKRVFDGVLKVNEVMQAIACIFLTFIMLLTAMNVILRIFGRPSPGAVQIIAICGRFVIGFTVPITSWMRDHVPVDRLGCVIASGVSNFATAEFGVADWALSFKAGRRL